MKVFAVGGKAFFHKDELKSLGFRWYREPKLWVKPESDEAHASGLAARLDGMNGVRWGIQDLPVDDMFRRTSPNPAPSRANQDANVSSLDRARAAAAKIAAAPASVSAAPASNLATAEPAPKEEQDFTPELTRLLGRIDSMRLMLKEIEQDAKALAGRVEC
jgi:hypothetical protein